MRVNYRSGLFSTPFALAVLLQATAFGESKTMTWIVDGVKREAIVYLPSAKSPNGKTPVVFAFHGYGDDMQNFQHVDLQEAWPEAIVDFLLAHPKVTSDNLGPVRASTYTLGSTQVRGPSDPHAKNAATGP